MKHPFAELLGIHVQEQEPGTSRSSVAITESLLNPHNVAHGGVLYSLADTCMGSALYPMLSEGELCATIEIKMNYFAPVRSGEVTCLTKVVNKGKTVANLASELFAGDRLVANANGNYAIFRPNNRI
ncbi:PaaI family thioesterase [Ectothiorhodospiraceae bacterium WFHF3C12]|nr:PaaI family thioesterase [Ectothiorhodospiraceae bacterium WFHF3C12]